MLTIAPARRRRRALLVLIAATGTVLPASAAGAVPLPAGSTAVLSGQPSLLEPLPAPVGHSASREGAVSGDGRYVVFSSYSDGLSDEDDDTVENVYVKDRATGSVEFVSRSTGEAGEPSHDRCTDAVISDDGTTVAFTCDGPLTAEDTNERRDVYRRRLPDSTTLLVSRATGEQGAIGDQPSRAPAITANGNIIAFESEATNLVGDTQLRMTRVYRRTFTGTPTTALMSRVSQTNVPARGEQPSVDDAGNVVAFSSPDKLNNDDANGVTDVYVRDPSGNGHTSLVSRVSGATGTAGDGPSDQPVIAGGGGSVAFVSRATNFDPTLDGDAARDIYVRGLIGSQATTLVSVGPRGKAKDSRQPAISADGSAVAFIAESPGFHPDATTAVEHAYVKRIPAGDPELVSRGDGDNGPVSTWGTDSVALSGDGKAAVAGIQYGAVAPASDSRESSVIVRDLGVTPRRTESVARPAGDEPFVNQGGYSNETALSADGRFAAFVTEARGLGVPDDTPGAVVVRDRITGAVTIASRRDGTAGAPMPGELGHPSISADGRKVAWAASAPDEGVWVRDLAAGTTTLASRATGATGAVAIGGSFRPVLDADGSRVAFLSQGSNLTPDDTDSSVDSYIRDLETGDTILASRGVNGTKANSPVEDHDLNDDGTRLVFSTNATNLGDGDSDAIGDVHLRDVAAGTTQLLSHNPAGGPKGDNDSFGATIDGSGTRVAFTSNAKNLAGGGPAGGKVYVRDLRADTLELVSRMDGEDGAPVIAGYPSMIDPSGRFVAFASDAPAITGASNSVDQTYVRDIAARRTELVSRTPSGEPGPMSSNPTDITAGGHCVALFSRNLVPSRSDKYNVYMRVRTANCGDAVPAGPGGGGTGTGGGGARPSARDTTAPVLTKARVSRKRFRIARGATAVAAATGRGTVLSFRSSEAATVTVQFERVLPGKRVGSRCRPVKKRPKKRACTVHKRAGTITRTVRAGNGRVSLTGRLGRKAMARGAYRLTLTAKDAAGNKSKPVRVAFTIVK